MNFAKSPASGRFSRVLARPSTAIARRLSVAFLHLVENQGYSGAIQADSSSEPTLSELVAEVPREQVVERLWSRLQPQLPEWVQADPVARRRIHEYVESGVATEVTSLRSGRLPDRCPDSDAEAARELARLNMRADVPLAAYRLGHRALWEVLVPRVERRVPDPAARRELLDRAAAFLFDYTERLTSLLTDEYEAERDRISRSPEHRRLHLIRDLLEGRQVDSGALGWPLDHHHLGILAWADGADQAARELAAAAGRPVMLVETSVERTWWGWASGAAPLTVPEIRKLSRFQPAAGRLALGLDLPGVEGFRLTHRQASRAGWVAWSTRAPVTCFADCAPEGLAAEDFESAKAFAAAELGGLADGSPRAERLTQALRAYFEAGHSLAAAAAALGVHPQTVGNRVRAAEDVIGRPVGSRRAQLELALRLLPCLEVEPSVEVGLRNDGYLPDRRPEQPPVSPATGR